MILKEFGNERWDPPAFFAQDHILPASSLKCGLAATTMISFYRVCRGDVTTASNTRPDVSVDHPTIGRHRTATRIAAQCTKERSEPLLSAIRSEFVSQLLTKIYMCRERLPPQLTFLTQFRLFQLCRAISNFLVNLGNVSDPNSNSRTVRPVLGTFVGNRLLSFKRNPRSRFPRTNGLTSGTCPGVQ